VCLDFLSYALVAPSSSILLKVAGKSIPEVYLPAPSLSILLISAFENVTRWFEASSTGNTDY